MSKFVIFKNSNWLLCGRPQNLSSTDLVTGKMFPDTRLTAESVTRMTWCICSPIHQEWPIWIRMTLTWLCIWLIFGLHSLSMAFQKLVEAPTSTGLPWEVWQSQKIRMGVSIPFSILMLNVRKETCLIDSLNPFRHSGTIFAHQQTVSTWLWFHWWAVWWLGKSSGKFDCSLTREP